MLSESVTLTDLVADQRLSNPKRYLRMALANTLYVGKFGTVSLRIGRSGTGIWPHYILEAVPSGSMIGRYEGQNHKAWTGESEHHAEHWSTTTMLGEALHQLWQQVTFNA